MPDLARIQSLVVHSAWGLRNYLLFFKIGSVPGARAFLRACLNHVPSAAEQPPRASPILHFSFSWRGLSRLATGHEGLDPADGRAQLEPSFVEPVPINPAALGFVSDSAPERWWSSAWTNAEIDLALHGFFADDAQATAEITRWRALAVSNGLIELNVPGFAGGALNGHRPENGILHFGFRDGITALAIDWTGDGSAPTDFREMLLGYPSDEYPSVPYRDGPWKEFVRDGSIACVAWIEQHVHRFNQFLKDEGARLAGIAPSGLEQEWLAARLMGRWRDGSPVMRWPDAPAPTPDLDDRFGYVDDPKGVRCPLNAHIRIANPRDDALKFAVALKFPKGPPRLARRGFTYGPPLVGDDDDGVPRGIVGVFFCARVNEQFFSVLRWMQATTFNDAFARPPYSRRMQDAMLGARRMPDADLRLPIVHEHGVHEVSLRDFISYRGVTHLLMPSLPSLGLLARDP